MVDVIFVVLVSLICTMLTCGVLEQVTKLMNYISKTGTRRCFFGLLVFIYWLTWFCLGFEV